VNAAGSVLQAVLAAFAAGLARACRRVRTWRIACASSLIAFALAAGAHAAPVVVLPVKGAIGPASADFIVRGIAQAQRDGAPLVILQMDTPGGLDTSMREIIQAILASPVPVATFVAPSGARAASAGTYILYASHIAAMAPGTNLGAATPVQIGGSETSPAPAKTSGKDGADEHGTESTMTRKQTHDAAAYIRGLAQLRGRNAEWAERAVREAVSLPANDALAQHVIDFIARDAADVAAKSDGRKVSIASGEHVIATRDAPIVVHEVDWRSRLLAVITDPSIALILMLLGTYGLFFEFSNPGFVLPGVVGAIALLLGLFALNMLPVSYAGLALVLLGLGFVVAEGFLPTYGSLGVGGVIAFAVGAVMLADTDELGFGVPLSFVIALAVIVACGVGVVSTLAMKARRRPVVTGGEQLIGSEGVMLEDAEREGWARVRSEHWRVRSDVPLKRGDAVRVVAREGLVLSVVPEAQPALLAREST
jgi:membrane-bound serine protease (ClpP class)